MADEVRVRPEPAASETARRAIGAYLAELDARFPGGFDPSRSVPADADELAPPHGDFLVAEDASGAVVGCGGVKALGAGVFEIKRMWVAPATRGRGVGRLLLAALEARAGALGGREVRLDTSAHLAEAIGLYRGAGYEEIPAYNDNPYAAHWFRKRLA